MDLPDYIRTEWRNYSQSTLYFNGLDVYDSSAESIDTDRPKYRQPFNPKGKYGSIQCFISTFNVWEYKEYDKVASKFIPKRIANSLAKDQPNQDLPIIEAEPVSQSAVSAVCDKNTCLINEDKDEDEFEINFDSEMPPGISYHHWIVWKRFWQACLPRYIQLAWAHRFRELTEETLACWHEEYIKNTPEIVPHLEYNLYVPLEAEADLKSKFPSLTLSEIASQADDSDEDLLAEVYNEFSEKRKWSHFRIYLEQIFFNPDESLRTFLQSKGIAEDPKFDVFQAPKSSKVDENESPPIQDEGTCTGNDATVGIESCNATEFEIIDAPNEKTEMENLTLKPDETSAVESQTIVENGLDDGESVNEDLGPNILQQDTDSKSIECEQANLELGEKVHNEPEKTLEVSAPQAIELPPKVEGNHNETGIGWAMRHLQNLNNGTRPTDLKTFKFGTEDVPPQVPFLTDTQIAQLPQSKSAARRKKKKAAKRKRDQDQSPPEESGLGCIFGVFGSYIKMAFKVFMRGFMALLGTPLIRLPFRNNPFSAVFSFFSFRKIPQPGTYKSILERKSMNCMKNCIRPVLRKFPAGSIMPNSVLVDVSKEFDIRRVKSELVQVVKVENEKCQVWPYYLTEADYEEILEEIKEVPMPQSEVEGDFKPHTIFDDDGKPQAVVQISVEEAKKRILEFDADMIYNKFSQCEMMDRILSYSTLLQNSYDEISYDDAIEEVPKEIRKYWHQRFRLFLKYEEGIKLDKESWYSATPEMISAHHAERCCCDVVVDAFCGAGGNAIQLAETCNHVIAIDKDPEKIALARHNAGIYGVADRIDFIVGDFFKIAPTLKADAVFLAPPWGGINYNSEEFYDLYTLGGVMDGKELMEAACKISTNIALYLPRNSNIYQIMEFAGYTKGRVDIEFAHIANKRKCVTAYYGDLVYFSLSFGKGGDYYF